MSKFHEIIKELLEDVQKFLVTTLETESLTSNAISKRESLLVKLLLIREEYPQLHLNPLPNEAPKESNKPMAIQIVPSKPTTAPASPPPYFDMQGITPSPILAPKPEPTNSEEYEEFDGDLSETIESAKTDAKSLSEVDTSNLEESLKEIPGVSAADLKKSEKYGYLEKKGKERLGGLLSPFQKRWCAIQNGTMYIFDNENDKKQKSHIELFGYESRTSPNLCKDVNKKNLCFELVCPGKRTYQFIALTAKDLKQWMGAVERNTACITNDIADCLPTIISSPLPTTEISPKIEIKIEKQLPKIPLIIPQQPLEEDIYEPIDELETSPGICEPLYEEGDSLPPSLIAKDEEELYVDGGEHPPTEEPMNQAEFNPTEWYVALWDCACLDPMELPFSRGDLIRVISKEFDANAWWTGTLHNKTGLVPKNYLMEAYEAIS